MDFLGKPVPRMTQFAGVRMTMPAFLVIMVATILFAITSLMAIFAGKASVLFMIVLAYAGAIYSTYVINCLTVGSCNLLAWILGVVYVIMVGLVIIGYVVSVAKKGYRATVAEYKPRTMM